jgi:hypothetical protein
MSITNIKRIQLTNTCTHTQLSTLVCFRHGATMSQLTPLDHSFRMRSYKTSSIIPEDAKEAERYLCNICLQVANDAVLTQCDQQHLFCRSCIAANQANNYRDCPICRTEIRSTLSTPFMQRIINSLKVKCISHDGTDTFHIYISIDIPKHRTY